MRPLRVLVVTLFTATSGSSRVMAFQFLPLLRQQGLESDVLTVYPDEFFKVHMGLVESPPLRKAINFAWYLARGMLVRLHAAIVAGRYDVVYIQRDSFPEALLWLLQRMNPHVVYQFEDTFAATNPFLKKRSAIHRALLDYQVGLYRNMVAKAEHIIASNALIGEEAATVNPNVSVVCEPLDLTPYRNLPGKPPGEGLVIGWIGSPSTTSFLRAAERPLATLCQKYPNLTVRLVGASADFEMPGVRLDKRRWTAETEVSDLCSFDVGIMPQSDDPFHRTHLGHKMIQYMAVGIPFVATRTELNERVVVDGENGYLAGSDEEWVERLSRLLDDPALRVRLGKRGRAIVEEQYALEKQVEVLANALRRAAGSAGLAR